MHALGGKLVAAESRLQDVCFLLIIVMTRRK